MAVWVRAGLIACVGSFALSALAPSAASADPATSPASADPAPSPPLLIQAVAQAPAYFVLQDRAEPAIAELPIDTQDPIATGEPTQLPPDTTVAEDVSAEAHCLAVAVYYEARGEPRAGQFAVAHVVINRAHSGRFATTLCGVVRQPGQFSFRNRSFSPPDSADWRKAVTVAQAAIAGSGTKHAHGALYFHASAVAPAWGRPQVAQIGHQIFYR